MLPATEGVALWSTVVLLEGNRSRVTALGTGSTFCLRCPEPAQDPVPKSSGVYVPQFRGQSSPRPLIL